MFHSIDVLLNIGGCLPAADWPLYNLQDLIHGDKIVKHSLINEVSDQNYYVFFFIFLSFISEIPNIITMTNLLYCIVLHCIVL